MDKDFPKAQNPLLLRFHRLMDAFAKSDDERDFYLDRVEGFIIYVDLDKSVKELEDLEEELAKHSTRYCLIPKMTFYETKKFMEGFVNEKVYDIDTKEKLLDVIQSKDARENFLEFIYDHLSELEKWQLYYHERSRIRIIEWLRLEQIQFVFEEDLDLTKSAIEKIKRHLFDVKVPKDIALSRENLFAKAKTYYSYEALNPRPKRGRPPKQVAKVETELQITADMYLHVPTPARLFLYLPDISSPSAVTFSARFDTEAQLIANLRGSSRGKVPPKLEVLSQRLESLRHLSSKLANINETSGIAGEDRLIKVLTKETPEETKTSEKKESRILGVVKGFLPKKSKDEKTSPEEADKKAPSVKSVTPILSKFKPKKN